MLAAGRKKSLGQLSGCIDSQCRPSCPVSGHPTLRQIMVPFALTIFTGAFLLFQVQPLIGKYILPWFGGGPGVWTTCLLFFQTVLLGGYAYAHFTSMCLLPKQQVIFHFILIRLLISLIVYTISEI